MPKSYLAVLAVLILLTACGGNSSNGPAIEPEGQTPSPSPTPSPAIIEPSPPPESVPVALHTRSTIYWGNEPEQFGDLYLPNPRQEEEILIIMIHGGCWASQFTLDLQAELSEALADRGHVVWNIEYRSLGNGGDWPTMFQDVASATDFLKTLSDEHSLQLDNVVSMGHSAGGHLALWLASRHKISATSELYIAAPQNIHGVVGLGAIPDLTASTCGTKGTAIIDAPSLSESELNQRLTNTSPIEMLPTGIGSIFISGATDTIVPPSIPQAYVDQANNAGDMSEHLVIDGADHFFLIDGDRIDIALLEDSVRRVLGYTGH